MNDASTPPSTNAPPRRSSRRARDGRRVVLGAAAVALLPGLLVIDAATSATSLGSLVQLHQPVGLTAMGGVAVLAWLTARLLSARMRSHLALNWLRLWSVAAVVLLGIVGSELLLRRRQPPAHLHLANQRYVFRTGSGSMRGVSAAARFRTNSRGLRGSDNLAEARLRILCVGGSTTECLYLDQGEAWPQLLSRRLAARTGERVAVHNAGRSGRTSGDHLRFLRSWSRVEAYDLVVVLPGINDLQRALAPPQPRPAWMRSALLQAAAVAISGQTLDAQPSQDCTGAWYEGVRARRAAAPKRSAAPPLGAALAGYAERVRAIIAACRARGVECVFLTQPVLWRTDLTPALRGSLWFGWLAEGGAFLSVEALRAAMDAFNATLQAVCLAEGVRCVDLARALNGEARAFYDDCHFTEWGAAEVSRLVAAALAPTRLTASVVALGAAK